MDQTLENLIFTVLWDTTVAPINENGQNSRSSVWYYIVFPTMTRWVYLYLFTRQKQLKKVGLVKHLKKRYSLYFVRSL